MIKVFSGFGKVKRADIKARVYRAATGKWEDLGVIASTDWKWNLVNKIKEVVKKWL